MIDLPRAFLKTPLAHRALHDVTNGRPENSRAAIQAAIDAGYGIEIDVQQSSDGAAMVFHDDLLDRLAESSGPIRDQSTAALTTVTLRGGNDEGIPTLPEVLELVNGQVPVLIEIKDQDGAMGANIGVLERSVARDVEGYQGPLALMSFNPHSVRLIAQLLPDVPRGLTSGPMTSDFWTYLPDEARAHIRAIPDFDDVGASFISHQMQDLAAPRVAELKDQGAAILCWTVKSAEQEQEARLVADNITFEGYLAEH